MSRVVDLVGQKFGRLTVVKKIEPSLYKNQQTWLCKCDCGNEKITYTHLLKEKKIQSCGCMRSEMCSNKNFVHGKSETSLYNVWRSIKQRCLNPNDHAYKYYGGRGITICDEWKDSYEKFYDWALENGYKDKLTIDRIDPNGNYEPSNCRWIPLSEQNSNKRNNRSFDYNGKHYNTISEFAKSQENTLHLSCSAIAYRLRQGWSVEKTITTPLLNSKKD